MLNHARTLLLNRDATASLGATFPGEELVPAGFRELSLPAYLRNIRTKLFGSTPDRFMLNYRLRQFMTLLHATPLAQYVTALDSRLSYLDAGDDLLQQSFRPAAKTPTTDIAIIGDGEPPDMTGLCHYCFGLEVAPGGFLAYQIAPPTAWTASGQLDRSELAEAAGVLLARTGYSVLLLSKTEASYRIDGFLRPQWSLGEIAAAVQSSSEPDMLQLFGTTADEPWQTFRNLWYHHRELPYRLGGLLLAIIYRTEELRRA